jgi:hypothetical protein
MNTFKKKSLYLAVAGVSALGAGAASGVTLNADGLGQVLLYPYYTVRETSPGNAYNSLLSVVNSTASAKAVKVRFLEGKNSREVLDFNLYLSHHDVWVAAIIPTADGAGIVTPDNSCTDPAVSQDENNPSAFVNFAYVASRDDPANDDLDRVREGYVEIIEMGAMWGYGEFTATHANGVPHSCSYLRTAYPNGNPHANYYTTVPSGGLFGSMTLVNVGTGVDFGYDPVALSQFSTSQLWFPPGDERPRLDQADPVSLVVDASDQNAAAYLTSWGAVTTVDPVSAVLMHDNVYNEFVLDKGTASKTDWIITMPTKTYYYTGVSDKELKVTKLFQRNFKSTGACDDVTIVKYDREERTVKTPGSFSPPPPTVKDSLCWEANVITFNSSNVFGSKNVANLTTTFENGWVSMNFPVVQSSVGPIPYSAAAHQLGGSITTRIDLINASTSFQSAATYYGLPVIGFAAWTFSNGTTLGGVLSNYGGNYIHKYTRDVSN